MASRKVGNYLPFFGEYSDLPSMHSSELLEQNSRVGTVAATSVQVGNGGVLPKLQSSAKPSPKLPLPTQDKKPATGKGHPASKDESEAKPAPTAPNVMSRIEQLVLSADGIHPEVKRRNLEGKREMLTAHAFDYVRQMEEKAHLRMLRRPTSREAIDKIFEMARAMTANSKDPIADALILAAGTASDLTQLRVTENSPRASNVLTADTLGEHSLHHFFVNAYNTYLGVPVGLQRFGSNVLRLERDVPDIYANNLGAQFGERLRRETIRPSEVMIGPPPKNRKQVEWL
jgi:hypothetical protein